MAGVPDPSDRSPGSFARLGTLTLSASVAGVAALAALVLTGATWSALPIVSLLSARPQVAFTILVGPTGLTFPCWAASRARLLTA